MGNAKSSAQHLGQATHHSSTSRSWWRRKRILIPLIALATLTLLVTFVWRSPSPVGHWDSAEGQNRFMSAYHDAFAAMPEVAETFDIRTDFGMVRVYRFDGDGDGPASFLLPGRSSATPVWADNMTGLLDIGDVYTVDLLGEAGMSIQERPISSDEDQAVWLQQTLGSLPEEAFHVVGLSIGGWNAVNLAMHYSEHVAAMTLIDPVFVFDQMPLGTILRSLPASMPSLPKTWRDSFNSYTAGGAPVEEEPVADMIEAGMQHYSLKLPQPSLIDEAQLKALDIPVLTIIAGDSVMQDAAVAAETAERTLPHGTERIYEGASHAVNGEQPEQIADDIKAFLAQNTTP